MHGRNLIGMAGLFLISYEDGVPEEFVQLHIPDFHQHQQGKKWTLTLKLAGAILWTTNLTSYQGRQVYRFCRWSRRKLEN